MAAFELVERSAGHGKATMSLAKALAAVTRAAADIGAHASHAADAVETAAEILIKLIPNEQGEEGKHASVDPGRTALHAEKRSWTPKEAGGTHEGATRTLSRSEAQDWPLSRTEKLLRTLRLFELEVSAQAENVNVVARDAAVDDHAASSKALATKTQVDAYALQSDLALWAEQCVHDEPATLKLQVEQLETKAELLAVSLEELRARREPRNLDGPSGGTTASGQECSAAYGLAILEKISGPSSEDANSPVAAPVGQGSRAHGVPDTGICVGHWGKQSDEPEKQQVPVGKLQKEPSTVPVEPEQRGNGQFLLAEALSAPVGSVAKAAQVQERSVPVDSVQRGKGQSPKAATSAPSAVSVAQKAQAVPERSVLAKPAQRGNGQFSMAEALSEPASSGAYEAQSVPEKSVPVESVQNGKGQLLQAEALSAPASSVAKEAQVPERSVLVESVQSGSGQFHKAEALSVPASSVAREAQSVLESSVLVKPAQRGKGQFSVAEAMSALASSGAMAEQSVPERSVPVESAQSDSEPRSERSYPCAPGDTSTRLVDSASNAHMSNYEEEHRLAKSLSNHEAGRTLATQATCMGGSGVWPWLEPDQLEQEARVCVREALAGSPLQKLLEGHSLEGLEVAVQRFFQQSQDRESRALRRPRQKVL
eukprot:TRINITY_DN4413_c0_g1_i4.p1 TRINITY_DN4413_c0_g1~~TRINITY_DN4413_c0_g1_i4.p1  ORF type:complete len:654 (-),score=142.19 TRINITY_DN4413_c0_g1_i4:156-2117(-)